MWKIVRRLGIVLAVLTLATPAWAQRACKQSDLAGVWELYIGGGEAGGPWTGWAACRVRVGPQGAVRAVRAFCVNNQGSTFPFRIVGGRLTVEARTCVIGGQFIGEPLGEGAPLEVSRATLTRSGELVAGVVEVRRGGDLMFSGLFQMIRF